MITRYLDMPLQGVASNLWRSVPTLDCPSKSKTNESITMLQTVILKPELNPDTRKFSNYLILS